MYNYELYHHGIKGMRWGIRRFQNRDGTLTDVGKRRLSGGKKGGSINFDTNGKLDMDPLNLRKAHSKIREEAANDNQNVSSALNSGANVARTSSNITGRLDRNRRDKIASGIDVSSMSDTDLRSAINRMDMERRYKQLRAEQIAPGRDKVSDFLATAGDVLAIGASAASIAVAIYTIRK